MIPCDAWTNVCFRQLFLMVNQHMEFILTRPGSDWIAQLQAGTADPEQLPSMLEQVLQPNEWTAVLETEQAMQKLTSRAVDYQVTTSVTCAKCKNNEIYYYQSQTRSADEPMTTFYTCCNPKCSFRWKN
jgi:DNA-directed RNA polymerase subunit M/transcription elongation factor TFIIS